MKNIFEDEQLSLFAVDKFQNQFKSTKSGIAPIFDLMNSNIEMESAECFDKIVGKAAALLFVRLGVKRVHACVLSELAIPVFENSPLIFSYDKTVGYIENRDKSGKCPIELCVEAIDNPEEALSVITAALSRLKTAGK